MTKPFLSKSKYLNGLQCQKLLWFGYNAKEKIPNTDDSIAAIFEQGHLVGEYAKKRFPNGIEITSSSHDFSEMIAKTKEAIAQRRPLFEPAFRFKDAFARPDILAPVGNQEWDIIEVKSSTKVKDVYVEDLALQCYVYEGNALKIRRCKLMLINNKYVRIGDINPRRLLKTKDVTRHVRKLVPTVESNISKMLDVIGMGSYPNVRIGLQCWNPHECPMQEVCWSFVPRDSPFTFYNLRSQKKFELIHSGVLNIGDIPSSLELGEINQIQVEAVRSGNPHIDKPSIRSFLKKLKYPLYFLDFETIWPATPIFENTRPFEQIPFQYSLHVLKSAESELTHHGYLANGKQDPRTEILKRLKDLLGKKGSIVAYNASFEKNCIKDAISSVRGYLTWYKEVERRIVDLLIPFRSFAYYHPLQHGTASIKAVLPVLTGKSYSEMAISDGGTASREFYRVTFGEVPEDERKSVMGQLEEYCQQDTQSMIDIVRALQKLVI